MPQTTALTTFGSIAPAAPGDDAAAAVIVFGFARLQPRRVFADAGNDTRPSSRLDGDTASNRTMFGSLLAQPAKAGSAATNIILVQQFAFLLGDTKTVPAAVFIGGESIDYDGWHSQAAAGNKWQNCVHMFGDDAVALAAHFSANRAGTDTFAPFEAITGAYRQKSIYGPTLPAIDLFTAGDGTEHAGTAITDYLKSPTYGPNMGDADLAQDWTARIAKFGTLEQPAETIRLRQAGYDADPNDSNFTRYTPKNRKWRIDGQIPSTSKTVDVLREFTRAVPSLLVWTRMDGRLGIEENRTTARVTHDIADMLDRPRAKFRTIGQNNPQVKFRYDNYQKDFLDAETSFGDLSKVTVTVPGTTRITVPATATKARITVHGASGGNGLPSAQLYRSGFPLTRPSVTGLSRGGPGGAGRTRGNDGGDGGIYLAINDFPSFADIALLSPTTGSFRGRPGQNGVGYNAQKNIGIAGTFTGAAMSAEPSAGALQSGGGGGGTPAISFLPSGSPAVMYVGGAGGGQGGSTAILIAGVPVAEARGGGGGPGAIANIRRSGARVTTAWNGASLRFDFQEPSLTGVAGETIERLIDVTPGDVMDVLVGRGGAPGGVPDIAAGADAIPYPALPSRGRDGFATIEWIGAEQRFTQHVINSKLTAVPEHAKRAADGHQAILRKTLLEYPLPRWHLGLEPGDSVTVTDHLLGAFEGRILNIGYDDDLNLTVVAQVDQTDVQPPLEVKPAPPPVEPTPKPDTVAGTVAISALASLVAGTAHTFTATPTGGTYDTVAYAWEVVSGGGSITAAGVYTAPDQVTATTAVTIRVTATFNGDGNNAKDMTTATATATQTFNVTVAPPAGTLTSAAFVESATPRSAIELTFSQATNANVVAGAHFALSDGTRVTVGIPVQGDATKVRLLVVGSASAAATLSYTATDARDGVIFADGAKLASFSDVAITGG